jgi:uncharacterized membrane protein YsdA (DUF1294 family)
MTRKGLVAVVSTIVIAGILWNFGFRYFLPNPLPLYLGWLIASGIFSFVVYGYDKFKAVRGGYRVPENQLHLLALSGGFLGCALGMALFRHKIRKTPFKVIIFLAFLIHGLIFLSLLPL